MGGTKCNVALGARGGSLSRCAVHTFGCLVSKAIKTSRKGQMHTGIQMRPLWRFDYKCSAVILGAYEVMDLLITDGARPSGGQVASPSDTTSLFLLFLQGDLRICPDYKLHGSNSRAAILADNVLTSDTVAHQIYSRVARLG